jgi:hypothetical protein
MSAISVLAQTFEQNAKQQAAATTQAVESALKQHEQRLQKALQSSEQSLSAAIQRREKTLAALLDTTEASTRATVLKSWKWLGLSIALALSASFGALWWTSQQIASNLQALSEQKRVLAPAPQGAEFMKHEGITYLLLPPNLTIQQAGTSGQRKAYKLERK